MKTKHTPTPWSYQDPDSIDGGWIMTDARAWGRQVTGMFYGEKSERVANGHFITLACNHHEELVSLLEDERDALSIWICAANIPDDVFDGMQISRDKINSLLTKLKG